MILACGNYINGGNFMRGQADGFNIEILPKLKEYKNCDDTTNLLQYIVHFMKGTLDDKLPIPEPSDVMKCEHLNFEELEIECRNLFNELNEIKKVKDKVINESDPNHLEPFQETMNDFFEKDIDDIKEIYNLSKDCSNKYDLTLKFFRFNETSQQKNFFHIWSEFCQDYKDIWEQEQFRWKSQNERQKHNFCDRRSHSKILAFARTKLSYSESVYSLTSFDESV